MEAAADYFKTLWFGTLFGASFLGAPAVFAAICDAFAAFCAVLCGAERLSGGSLGNYPEVPELLRITKELLSITKELLRKY